MKRISILATALLLVSVSAAWSDDEPPRPYQGPLFFNGEGYVSTRFISAIAPLGDGSPIYAGAKPGGGKVLAVLHSEPGPGVRAVHVVPNEDIVVVVIAPKRTGLIGWKGWIRFTVVTERFPDGNEVSRTFPAFLEKVDSK
ncbi:MULTISPECIES: hypothetical protein [Rhizobium]|uniref:hypothetical protein n=1 Tax=Rhizobium TaxID=379 RepID=UPI000FEC7290|nr:hypothetical protein [Rhizobium leguminosarum]MBY2941076.1 hypothetical protein [Rhizobium leguminosarum]MBY3047213.1 hypothetical protein [Rhizobium leguminosarum]RWX22920.1 hypothetical protein EHI43_34865 [Rhizobium leguminosarum]